MKRERTYYTENPIIKEELRRYLKENGINPYISGCFDGWEFQMELSEEEAEKATWFLESLFEVCETKTITEFVGYNEDGIPCFESYEVKL